MRPKLSVQDDKLNRISSEISLNPEAREEFVNDPRNFLLENGIEIDSCNFVGFDGNGTTEICTVAAACALAAVLVVIGGVGFVFGYAVGISVYLYAALWSDGMVGPGAGQSFYSSDYENYFI